MQDHSHFTGQFRGAAHQHCNLNYKIDKSRYKLPNVFHNLHWYDAHLIFQKVKKGIYCYNYINSMERFDDTSLPSKEHFFNKLYEKHVS